MKVLHVPYCFHPDPIGGTEVYVEALAQRQREEGVETVIAAPGPKEETYFWKGLTVHRFQCGSARLTLRELYGEGDPRAAISFAQVLDAIHPDLVHLHAFTSGVSVRLMRQAKHRRLPVVFTYHTPAVSCSRGTLLENGREICDGKIEPKRCARCSLHGLGANRVTSWLLGNLSPAIGRSLGDLGLAGGPWTAARMSELIALRYKAFRGFMSEVDHVVAVCEWAARVLQVNGVPARKITVSRQGLPVPLEQGLIPNKPQENPSLLVAFLGRLTRMKGIDTLVEAVLAAKHVPLVLDIYGVGQDDEAKRIREELHRRSLADPRIRLLPAIAAEEVVATLRNYDVLAVSSQCLETGPLVVYEAFAAGIPVIGSNLGGIAELVQHGTNGLLLEPNSIDSWTRALVQLSENKDLLRKLKRAIEPPRSMNTVALEMLGLYGVLLAQIQEHSGLHTNDSIDNVQFDSLQASPKPTVSRSAPASREIATGGRLSRTIVP